jgi:hypothetical protein
MNKINQYRYIHHKEMAETYTKCRIQCCGSGSVCFSQYLGLPEPLLRRTDTDPSIIKKNSKRNLNSYFLVTSLSPFFNDVDVASKSKKQKSLRKNCNFQLPS